MPHPDQERNRANEKASEFFGSVVKAPDQSLAREVADLRMEVRALREALVPLPSLIQTGRDVIEEFKRLSGGAK